MKEQFVSFETAKLAKENGFASGGQHYYVQYHTDYVYDGDINHTESHNNGDIKIYHQYHNNHVDFDISNENFSIYEMPTQSLLQKWIRKNHFLHIVLIPTITGDMTFKIVDIQCNPEHEIERPPYKNVDAFDYRDYESALEAGLQEALELINKDIEFK